MEMMGIGVDLEPIESFRTRPFAKRKKFYERVFSPSEIAYCRKFRDDAPHFAVRYCAKEAFVKAARSRIPLHITDVEIKNNADGAPRFRPRGQKKAVLKFFHSHQAWLSLSHTDEFAMAFVVLLRRKGANKNHAR